MRCNLKKYWFAFFANAYIKRYKITVEFLIIFAVGIAGYMFFLFCFFSIIKVSSFFGNECALQLAVGFLLNTCIPFLLIILLKYVVFSLSDLRPAWPLRLRQDNPPQVHCWEAQGGRGVRHTRTPASIRIFFGKKSTLLNNVSSFLM